MRKRNRRFLSPVRGATDADREAEATAATADHIIRPNPTAFFLRSVVAEPSVRMAVFGPVQCTENANSCWGRRSFFRTTGRISRKIRQYNWRSCRDDR